MKRNAIIITAVIVLSAIVIGSAAYYRLSGNTDNTNELSSSLAASVAYGEVSAMSSLESSDSSEDSATLTAVPDGVYTNGSESMIFVGNTVDISGMVFNYTLENGYVVLDADNLTFSDEFKALYIEDNGDDQSLEDQLEKTKESASSITIQYNESFDWVTYEEYIFKRTEDYSNGPSGSYCDEENSDVTLTFDNGVATYVNGDITETHPYVLYLDGEDMIVTFYNLDLYSSNFYSTYCENNYFYFTDESSLDMGFGTFVKAE